MFLSILFAFSLAAQGDPLPAIESLQIAGRAAPGQEIQACGYSINGTVSCRFAWLRGLEDRSMNYIEGADQPTYMVTKDDVSFYVAVEVLPIDGHGRQGETVRVFANDRRKIEWETMVN